MDKVLEENLVKAFHLDRLPEKKQAAALAAIGKVVYERILLRVLEELPPEKGKAFDALLKAHGDDEVAVFNFLESNVPNFNGVIQQEFAAFKESMSDLLMKLEGTGA